MASRSVDPTGHAWFTSQNDKIGGSGYQQDDGNFGEGAFRPKESGIPDSDNKLEEKEQKKQKENTVAAADEVNNIDSVDDDGTGLPTQPAAPSKETIKNQTIDQRKDRINKSQEKYVNDKRFHKGGGGMSGIKGRWVEKTNEETKEKYKKWVELTYCNEATINICIETGVPLELIVKNKNNPYNSGSKEMGEYMARNLTSISPEEARDMANEGFTVIAWTEGHVNTIRPDQAYHPYGGPMVANVGNQNRMDWSAGTSMGNLSSEEVTYFYYPNQFK